MTWRLVDSGLSSPPFTAAADEAIALARSKDTVPNTLHFYRRSEPTVSLGYFQKASEDLNLDFCKEKGITIIRRVSGGSSIYTDKNHLIYGLVTGEKDMPKNKTKAYEMVCSALVIGLEKLGLDTQFKPVNDVLVGDRKISGSAQMRRRGVVLQHGTVILANDREMMLGALKADEDKISHMTSLEEEFGTLPAVEEVITALARGFEEAFGVRFESADLTDFEKSQIEELITKKYGSDEWNFRR